MPYKATLPYDLSNRLADLFNFFRKFARETQFIGDDASLLNPCGISCTEVGGLGFIFSWLLAPSDKKSGFVSEPDASF